MSRTIRSIVVSSLELGAFLAVGRGSIKVLATHVRSSSTGLAEEWSGKFERINNIDVGWISTECGISSRVLLGEVEGRPTAIGSSVGASNGVVDAVLVFVDAPSRVGPLDEVGNGRKLVHVNDSFLGTCSGCKCGNESNSSFLKHDVG